MEYVTLNNGIKMPKLGYGVYQTPPEDTKRCVLDAIEIGYRSIDTAQAYFNEEGVGAALAECGLPREEFFLTTKVWITNAGYENAKASIQESMEKLHTDYLDLLLIHQPFGDYYGTYRAMEELYQAIETGRHEEILDFYYKSKTETIIYALSISSVFTLLLETMKNNYNLKEITISLILLIIGYSITKMMEKLK